MPPTLCRLHKISYLCSPNQNYTHVTPKILITGALGQLGTEVREAFEAVAPGSTVSTDIAPADSDAATGILNYFTLDITDADAVADALRDADFTHIINCAAYTAVDRAEDEKIECTRINVDAVRNLAAAAADNGIKMLHISTDYVFDGDGHRPYTESDKTAPTSHYGATKRKGETALMGLLPDAIIIRTAWMYSAHGHNFVRTILAKAKTGATLRVVADQIGTPTYAADLADMIVRMVMAPQWLEGIYNFANEGVTSWYDFACAIVRLARIDDVNVIPVSSEDYPTAARRPYYSVLDKSKIKASYSVTIPNWFDSLERCMKKLV